MKKSKLKIVLAVVLVFVAACALFACGGGNPSPETPVKPGTEQSGGQTESETGSLKKFTDVAFTDKTVTYDGEEKKIELTGTVPKGANVEYDNNARTDAGEQVVTVTISCDGYETKTLTAKLTINKAKFDSLGISFNGKTVDYNGTEQKILLDGESKLPDGTDVRYSGNAGTDAGEYSASVTLSRDNYETKTFTAKLKINKAKFDSLGISFNGKTVDYNGTEQKILLDGESKLPDGTDVRYSGNAGTDAGEYSASVTLSRDNYETKTFTAKLKINRIPFPNKDDVKFKGKIFLGNGEKLLKVALNKTKSEFPDGTEISYSENEKKDAGKYHATVRVSNKNYFDINLECNWRIISIEEIVARIKEVINLKPSPLDYLPTAFGLENVNAASGNLTSVPAYDFANTFVDVSSINKHFVGKQLNAVYDMIESSEKILNACDAVTGAVTVVGNEITRQLLTKEELEELSFAFDINAAGFAKARFIMQGEKVGILLGNASVNAELYYDFETAQRSGRYQVLVGDLAGAAIRYYVGDDGLTLAYSVDVMKKAAAVKEIVISKKNGVAAGYLYEYTGTLTGEQDDTTGIADDDPSKEGFGKRSVAAIRSDSDTTVIMSNKRETDDMPMYGYEEVYDSLTGRFIGAEVSEYLKVEGKDENGTVKIDKKYDTFWFNLYDVSNFVDSIKAENKQNGMNMNTVYINGSANAIHSQWVINLAVSPTNPDTSRRFDIEMKDVYYVVKTMDGENVTYKREKTSLPMLFVQNATCKDRSGLSVKESTCVEEFGKNWVAKNYNKDETKSSGAKSTAPVLPGTQKLTANFASMKNLFTTVCEQVNYSSIKEAIGQPNAFFTA